MKNFLSNIAQKLWPDFQTLPEPDRYSLLRELFGTLYRLLFCGVCACLAYGGNRPEFTARAVVGFASNSGIKCAGWQAFLLSNYSRP